MRIDAVPYDHPDAATLIAEVQQEYVIRYGGEDQTPVDPADFAPPRGLFLVGYRDHYRADAGTSNGAIAEIKRMYVTRSARRSGLARLLLAELERSAREAGHRRVILEAGPRQPEALALYRSAGYTPIPAFGYYADAPTPCIWEKPSARPGINTRPGNRSRKYAPPAGPVRRARNVPGFRLSMRH